MTKVFTKPNIPMSNTQSTVHSNPMVIPKSAKSIYKYTGTFVYSEVNSISHDVGMWLFKYEIVKQHENHHSGTCEQESVCRKKFDFIFL